MAFLATATALAGLLAAANLLFTLGVVRRLREHTAELAELRSGSHSSPDDFIALRPGERVGEFAATDLDGRAVTSGSLAARTLVGFFSPGCAPCAERLPLFEDHAASRPGGRDAVLAVVVGTPAQAEEATDRLAPVATVVVEPDAGPVQAAFGVSGFPAFLLVEDGTVTASDYDLGSVAERDATALPAAG